MRVLSASIIALGLTVSVLAEERKVIHDSTEMNLTVNGDALTIAYQTPPLELREIGVVDGQVLLQGTWTRREPAVLVGNAFMFKENCEPIRYDIRGVIDYNGALVVIGPTPILKFQSCDVASLVWSDDAVMQFAIPAPDRKLVEKKRRGASEEQPKPKPKPKPKPRPRIERPAQQPRVIYPPGYPYQYQRPWGW